MSDNCDTLFLSEILLNFQYYRQNFNLEIGDNYVIVSIDDIFDKLIISNRLLSFIKASDIKDSVEASCVSVGDLLFCYECITEYIFKILINDTVHYYYAPGYESNVLCKIPLKSIDIIKKLCAELGLSCAIYSLQPYEKFEYINISYNQNIEDPFKFIKINNDNGKIKTDNWKINAQKLYVNTYKQKYWLNHDKTYMNARLFRKIMKFRWYKLLLPIAVFDDSINIPYLNHYIWKELEEWTKLKINLDIIVYCFKCFPLQLAGTTNHVLFQHKLKGCENWLHNWKTIFSNNVIQWTYAYDENFYYEEIFRLINFDYNYNGHNKFEPILRRALIYMPKNILLKYNYPLNLSLFDRMLDEISNKERMDIWYANINRKINDKNDFVIKYLNII